MGRSTEKMHKETDHHAAVFPMDIWTEILLRLPAEIVIKLKNVCKAWCELIKTRNFAIKHLEHWQHHRHHRTTTLQAIDMYCSPSLLVSFNFKDDGGGEAHFSCLFLPSSSSSSYVSRYVLDSCDGLLLVQTGSKRLFVCNPLVGSLFRLPTLKGYDNERCHYNWTIAFDPSAQAHVIVALRLSLFDDNGTIKPLPILGCSMLHLKKQAGGRRRSTWKEISFQVPMRGRNDLFCLDLLSISSMKGKVHWLLELPKRVDGTVSNLPYETSVLTLDVVTGESKVKDCSPMPPIPSIPMYYEYLSKFFKSKGRFYRLCHVSGGFDLELWGLKDMDDDDDDLTWSKQRVIISLGLDLTSWRVKGILKEDDKLIILHRFEGEVMYDTTSNKWLRLTHIYSKEDNYKGWSQKAYTKVYNHVNSLITLTN